MDLADIYKTLQATALHPSHWHMEHSPLGNKSQQTFKNLNHTTYIF